MSTSSSRRKPKRRLLARILEDALRSEPHSFVEVSHRQTALEIRVRVEDTLNSACPLDLDVRAFAVGMCTRTVFAKAEIVLWRTAPTYSARSVALLH